jgi:hypothetical protein
MHFFVELAKVQGSIGQSERGDGTTSLTKMRDSRTASMGLRQFLYTTRASTLPEIVLKQESPTFVRMSNRIALRWYNYTRQNYELLADLMGLQIMPKTRSHKVQVVC